MKWGFKTKGEKIAINARVAFGLDPHLPLDARTYGEHLGFVFIRLQDLPADEETIQTLQLDDGWSALSVDYEDTKVILHNETHSRGRQESDIMHEIGHYLCGHKASHIQTILQGKSQIIRDFDKEIEEEADWVAGCLKVPREGLLWALKQGMDNKAMVDYFRSNIKMVEFRRRVTGVDKQLRASTAKAKTGIQA